MRPSSVIRTWALGLGIAATIPGTPALCRAGPPLEPLPAGSLVTSAPLGEGRIEMLLGGGFAVILPFYEIGIGVGLGPRVDLVGRFETVLGIFHYPSVGIRWSPVDLGTWKLGTRASANYSFFGLATDQVDFTSTLYLTLEAGVSGPVTRRTDLFFSVDNEVDLLEYRSLDGKGSARGRFRYAATIFRLGAKTRLTDNLDGFIRARIRIPVETFRYEAMHFYVIPSLEIGATFSF
jgi:hypothetical protein